MKHKDPSEQKFIFITGAARGIGRETARLFVKKGWFVGLFDINEDGLQRLSEELGQNRSANFVGDVTKMGDLEGALSVFTSRTNGQLHVLFNNAGILVAGEFDQIPLKRQLDVIDVNLIGVINTTYAALPYLKLTPRSHIITMCSASAFFGNPELTVYAATKSAVKSLTEGWSIAFAKYDIHVSDLQPIYVHTSMVTDNLDKFGSLKEADIKLSPEKIARFVWKAAHSKRIHWPIGKDTKFFRFLMRLLPDRANRWILVKIIGYN